MVELRSEIIRIDREIATLQSTRNNVKVDIYSTLELEVRLEEIKSKQIELSEVMEQNKFILREAKESIV